MIENSSEVRYTISQVDSEGVEGSFLVVWHEKSAQGVFIELALFEQMIHHYVDVCIPEDEKEIN